MTNKFDFEEYIKDLSPELQEKAKDCKSKEELMELVADNDIEISEDALEAVAGGCSMSSDKYDQGDLVNFFCPNCGNQLRYWDMASSGTAGYIRYYCDKCNDGLWCDKDGTLKRW